MNKLIRELKCAKHDEENLAAMVRDAEQRVANQKSQLDQELETHSSLLKCIKDHEIL